jgi:hypothetical protein
MNSWMTGAELELAGHGTTKRTVNLLEAIQRIRFDNAEDGDDLKQAAAVNVCSITSQQMEWSRTFSFWQASEKNRSSLSSRRVRRQNRVCSKGRTFLIATCLPEGRCNAATTVPYAPSPRLCRSL